MARRPHVLVVEARFYDDISDHLFAGAKAVLDRVGATYERSAVPGALEIPFAIRMAAEAGDEGTLDRPFDGFVALGCVIRGETTHYEIVSEQSARAIMDLTLEGLAIGNGILTVEDEEQAMERAKADRLDKGGDAAAACLAMIDLKRRFGWTNEQDRPRRAEPRASRGRAGALPDGALRRPGRGRDRPVLGRASRLRVSRP